VEKIHFQSQRSQMLFRKPSDKKFRLVFRILCVRSQKPQACKILEVSVKRKIRLHFRSHRVFPPPAAVSKTRRRYTTRRLKITLHRSWTSRRHFSQVRKNSRRVLGPCCKQTKKLLSAPSSVMTRFIKRAPCCANRGRSETNSGINSGELPTRSDANRRC
jgi:hypothetical protein